jgi:hypothetical protein
MTCSASAAGGQPGFGNVQRSGTRHTTHTAPGLGGATCYMETVQVDDAALQPRAKNMNQKRRHKHAPTAFTDLEPRVSLSENRRHCACVQLQDEIESGKQQQQQQQQRISTCCICALCHRPFSPSAFARAPSPARYLQAPSNKRTRHACVTAAQQDRGQ